MIVFIDRCIQKLKRMYRIALFRELTGNKAEGLKIRGEIYIMNRNTKIWKNVSIYLGV